jgi:MoaA/NifB/PqqE/SkfB family radical SAM enzyme
MKIEKKTYDKLLKWVKKNTEPPLHVQIVPTNFCNIACIFCWRVWEQEDSKKKHLVDRIPDWRYIQIVNEICENPKLRPKSITITGGGEPMIKKELVVKMVEKIKQYNIHCEIVTNGTLFDEKTVRKLVESRLDNIGISINAASPKLADYLYGKKDSYRKTIKSMEILKKLKRKMKSEVPIVANTIVVTKYNYLEIPKMVKQAFEYDVRTVNVRWVSEPYCKGKPGPLTMPPEKYEEFVNAFEEAKQLAKKFNINLVSDFTLEDLRRYLQLDKNEDNKQLFAKNNPREEKNEESILEFIQDENAYEKLCKIGICTFPFYELFIDANGYASGCGTLASAGGIEENVAEDVLEKNIEEIWYGERLNHLRVHMLLREFFKTCESCNIINIVKMSREWKEKYEKNLNNSRS